MTIAMSLAFLPFGDAEVKPLRGGETLDWRLAA